MCICSPDNPEFSIIVLKHHLRKKNYYAHDWTSTFATTIVTLHFFDWPLLKMPQISSGIINVSSLENWVSESTKSLSIAASFQSSVWLFELLGIQKSHFLLREKNNIWFIYNKFLLNFAHFAKENISNTHKEHKKQRLCKIETNKTYNFC